MDQRNGDFRISKGRHVQLESELLSRMQRRLIGSEHERIERIMKEHRRALFLQLNGPNSIWRLGEVNSAKKETEHVDRRLSKYVPEQESAATDNPELSIRRDILPRAQTRESRGSQRYLRSTQSGRRKGHTVHDPSRCEIEDKNADTCEKSKLSPIFDETNEMTLNSNEYSAAAFSNDNELRPDMKGLNGMDFEKSSSQQKADENNVIYVSLETDVEKNDICASEGKFTKGDKRGKAEEGDNLDQNHNLVSQRAEIYKFSLQNKTQLRDLQGNIVHKVIADDADWAQASPPLTSIHDKLLKTNRFFAVSRRTSDSTPQISKAVHEPQPADDIKPTVLSNSSHTGSSTTQKRNVLFRDTSILAKNESKKESQVDVFEKVETVPEGRKVTFQDDLHQYEPSASETIEKAPSSRAHVGNLTESKKYDCKTPTTTCTQPAFSTMAKIENGPLKKGRFLFKGNGVTIPQATDKLKSESFPPRICSKNVWAPKVSITWEENEPMRVTLIPAEGSMRKRLTFREHKDLWPHVKIIVILRMLDGEHYYREIK